VPGLGGVVGRVRAAIHVDGAGAAIGEDFDVPCQDRIRERVEIGPDAQAAGGAHSVDGRVGIAFVLFLIPFFSGPTVGAEAVGVVDGQPCVIADEGVGSVVRTGGLAIGAGEVDLGASGGGEKG